MTFKKAEMAKTLRNGLNMIKMNPLNHKWLDFAIQSGLALHQLRPFYKFQHFKGNGYFTSVYDFYVFVTMITQFMTPLAYLIISYSIMSIELWNSQTPGVDQDFSKRGSIKMMIAVVIVFTICWIPWHLFATIKAFWRDMAEL